MKKTIKRLLSIALCMLLLLSLLPMGALGATLLTDPVKIMEAAKALAENEAMMYDVTLSGEVISIDDLYSVEFKNVTATISVTGTSDSLILYRLKGDGVEELAVGDTVTVSGRIKNYYGRIEMDNCTMTARISGGGTPPVQVEASDPKQIVDEAYALAPGASLPYKATLTGKIVSVDTEYSAQYMNITVTIAVEGREDKPIMCYRLKGTGAESLKVGDTITVSGTIKNYQNSSGECTVEFDSGCTLDKVIPGATVPEDPEPIKPQSGKLYCLPPADWDVCYVYTWDGSGYTYHGDWPGTLMTRDINGLWSCDVPSGAMCVIFNSGDGGAQTADMWIPTDDKVLYEVATGSWVTFDSYFGAYDPQQIVDAAYALAPGEILPYAVTLTGKLVSIDTEYDTMFKNITVTIAVEGREDKPIMCYRLRGTGVDILEAGDIITVTGTITNYMGNIEFAQGCTLDKVKRDEYRVVGNADFMGRWDAASNAGLMECVSLGVYATCFYNVPIGTYQFRLTKNGVWDDSVDGPYNDYFCFAVEQPGWVRITYTTQTGDVDITVENGFAGDTTGYRVLTVVAPYSWQKVYAYAFAPESLGSFPGTELALSGGVYKQLLTPDSVNLLLSGELANGSRQLTDAITLENNGLDATVSVADDGSHTISYGVFATDSYCVVGNANWMGAWDVASNAGVMTELVSGVYHRRFEDVASGQYQFVITKNGTWDETVYGPYDGYFAFVVFDTCDVTVTYTLETGEVDIVVENGVVGNDLPDRTLTVIAPHWSDVYAYTWEPQTFDAWPGTLMPMVNGIYQMTIPGLMTNLIINGWTDSGYRYQTDDLALTVNGQDVLLLIDEDAGCEIRYGLDPFNWLPESLALVGSGLPGIGEWNPADPEGDMIPVSGSAFVYEKVLDVTAGTSMTFRIVGNDTWDDQWNFAGANILPDQSVMLECGPSSQDLQFSVVKDCRLRFILDLSRMPFGGNAALLVKQEPHPNATRKLTVIAPATWTTVDAYTWEPATLGNFPGTSMVKSGEVYELIIPQIMTNLLLSGLKANGSRSMTGNITLEANDHNVNIVIAEDGSYRLFYENGLSDYRVVGNAAFMGNWTPDSDMGQMEEISLGVYQKCFENVAPGTYEFKITKDGRWDDCIPPSGMDNFVFTVPQTCFVTVTYIFETGEASIALDNITLQPGDISGDGRINTGDVAKLYAHIRGTSLLTAAGALANADFTGDGKINIGDTARIYARIRGTDTETDQ